MYNFIRLIICILIVAIIAWIVNKSKIGNKKKAYSICGLIGIALFLILGFVPFENIFCFSSASEAFEYRNPDAETALVVEGNESDYVIGNAYIYGYEQGYWLSVDGRKIILKE